MNTKTKTIAQDYLDNNMTMLKSNIDTFVNNTHANYCEIVSLLEEISSDTRCNIEEMLDSSEPAKERRSLRYRVSANNKLKLIEIIAKL